MPTPSSPVNHEIQRCCKRKYCRLGCASKDYVLYCVKFINQWHASYLRRGVDQITNNGTSSTAIRHKQYVENDEISSPKTASTDDEMNSPFCCECHWDKQPPRSAAYFDSSNKITVSTTTEGFTATGNGYFCTQRWEKLGQQRPRCDISNYKHHVRYRCCVCYQRHTPVAKDRGVKLETFNLCILK